MTRTGSLLATTLLILLGCTEPGAERSRPIPPGAWPPPAADATPGDDLGVADAEPGDEHADASTGTGQDQGADQGASVPTDTGADVAVVVPDDIGPGDVTVAGGFGSLCQENSDCNSGYCVNGPDAYVCSVACMSECPDGWECKQLLNDLPDVSFICLPELQPEPDAPEQGCPTAVVDVAEGSRVAPQTVLHLNGTRSTSPNGEITSFEWSVEQPAVATGTFAVLVPSPSYPSPTFEANVAGTYRFSLTVRDEDGEASCEPAVAQIRVVPDRSIHVELLWNTPGDVNQIDTGPHAGADVDLHFVHPFATGEDVDEDGEPDGWFDQPFDCFWFNPKPDWGSLDPAVDDNPSMDRDDTDGAGPEIVSLDVPERGLAYRLGVHYWEDHGFGPSYATLRIYVYGELVWEADGVKLNDKDLWFAAILDWPSGRVTAVPGDAPGGLSITPGYVHPLFE